MVNALKRLLYDNSFFFYRNSLEDLKLNIRLSKDITFVQIDNQFHAKARNENYFLNVDISIIMHDPKLKLYICIKHMTV